MGDNCSEQSSSESICSDESQSVRSETVVKRKRKKEMSDDDFYDPSSSEESSDEAGRSKKVTKKNSKKTKSNAKRQKMNPNPTKPQNHDDFFLQLEDNSREPSNHGAASSSRADSTPNEGGLYDKLKCQLKNISHQNSHEFSELRDDINDLKRMVAKIEVLLKCRKENSTDSDGDFLNTLKSFGLPIDTKEDFDALEQRIKRETEKAKLVCVY